MTVEEAFEFFKNVPSLENKLKTLMNLDMIKSADHVIDLGPEGGDAGGYIVSSGTPEQVSKNKKSYTGKFLENIINDTN